MVRRFNNNPNARVSWDAAASARLLRLYAGGVEFKEIAERLGCTKSAAHQQLSALRQRARGSAYWAEQISAAEICRAKYNVKRGGRRKGSRNPNGGNRNSFRSSARVAVGTRISETMIEVGVTLDDETFGEIAARAKSVEHSFSAEVRSVLSKWGWKP